MGNGCRNAGHLTVGVGIEVAASPFVPSQHVGQIAGAPSGQRHSPSHGSVQPRLTVPGAVGSRHYGRPQRVEKGIGRVHRDLPPVVLYLFLGGLHPLAERFPVHVLQPQTVAHHLCESPFLPVHPEPLQFHAVALQASRLVHADVTVARQPFLPHARHDGIYLRHLREAHRPEVPGGTVGIGQTAHVEQQTGASPAAVLNPVPALSPCIASLACGSAVQRHRMSLVCHLETDVPAVARILEQGEHRAVARLQAVGRSSRVSVIAVLAHHHVVVRHILHFPCCQMPLVRVALVVLRVCRQHRR